MPYVTRIVCLANSRKNLGFCVAGKELVGESIGSWSRPVSRLATGQLSADETAYSDGLVPALLDILDIGLLSHEPEAFQSENHLIDTKVPWTKRGTFEVSQVNKLLDDVPSIWLNESHSNAGLNDRLHVEVAGQLNSSLLCPDDLEFRVTKPWDKKTVRARFTFKHVTYDFRVTDPVIETEHLGRPIGYKERGNGVLCISLAPPFNGYCYKLVAGVIAR